MVSLIAKPETIDIDPAATALVIVDMQNAFATKGGMFDLAGFDISGAAPAIEVNRRLLDAARKAGVKVVHLQMTYHKDLRDGGDVNSPNYHKELGLCMMRARPELAGKLLIDGSWDWQIVDALKPIAGEKIVKKNRYSGFVRTDLEDWLRGQNVRNLLFTGIATNVCVESTARDAYFAEFWPIMIEDAMNNSGPSFNRDATLWNFEHVFGWVTNSANVMAALQQGAQKAA
ncbi:MAG TPA: cysteine hydrolase [Xanthobacteraceae bacterium]|nr:cysteine hydrolase [Xanthobacteraceae bacterium]